jgi:simple sugar transport system permease protein
VLNVLVIGLTGFLYSRFLTEDPDRWNNPPRLPNITIPVLSEIPVIGPVFFEQNLIVYLMYITVILVQVGLFSTRWGLRVRAVGEHPQAADSVGIRVNSVRFRTVVLGAAVAGLGGAFFTLGSVGAFGREMTAGNGFIALAAVIFGRWTPLGSAHSSQRNRRSAGGGRRLAAAAITRKPRGSPAPTILTTPA